MVAIGLMLCIKGNCSSNLTLVLVVMTCMRTLQYVGINNKPTRIE